ncbi:hypothetical protein L1987_01374 [Smallanthus sonchifolius]|uniref:Uncharacterized protein n=1 Tax=Smallanthus sonchifolius TaxID=185202 RepID=A0ACB9K4V6_9ASTR|nr:hypothetical protein L1987_01374 [Smallanthus sonchifolius]
MKSALARKGRNKAASSSTARAKKARQPEPETEQIPKPNWRKTEALCDQHEVWQEELYYEKMAGEALSFRDEEGKNKIPREVIYQWNATLKKDLWSNPPRTTTLTGKVGNKSMVMSFDSIKHVVNFDSKSENLYQYLPEGQIYKQNQGEEASRELKELLFQPGSLNKERKDLNILPKPCVVIGGHNIIPRTSDKGMVHISKDMCAIPHCRLITTLMRTQRVLDEDSQYTFKVHRFFSVKGLHDMENWKYTLTERIHILKDRKMGQVLFGVREYVPSLAEDLMEEEEEEGDTEEGESESETEIEKATRRLKKSIHEHVVANRPTEYAEWDRPFQMLWDQNARSNEIHNRRMTKLEEDQKRHALAVQWAIQEEVNDRHRDAEARRRYNDWVRGRVFKDNPAPIPWEQMQPYQGGRIPFSYLKTHASRWVPLQYPRHLRSPAEVGHRMHLIFMAHCRMLRICLKNTLGSK